MRRLIGRTISVALAMAVLFIFLLAPMALYRLATGAPLSGPGAEWEVWLLIGGGALGASAARFIHDYLLTAVFRLDE